MARPKPPGINELRLDKPTIQAWYNQSVSIASQIFHFGLDGSVSRERLIDLYETLDNFKRRVGRAAGMADED